MSVWNDCFIVANSFIQHFVFLQIYIYDVEFIIIYYEKLYIIVYKKVTHKNKDKRNIFRDICEYMNYLLYGTYIRIM